MKMLLVTTILALSGLVHAEDASKDGVAILTMNNNGNYLLGRVHLSESDKNNNDVDTDSFSLPECSGSDNVMIEGIRLRAPQTKPNNTKNFDALITRVTIVFNNGQAMTVDPNANKGHLTVTNVKGDSMDILFNTNRCVRSVTILGEQFEKGNNARDAVVNVVGLMNGVR